MKPRLQRYVRLVASIVGISGLVGVGVALAQKDVTAELIFISALHGVVISFTLVMLEFYLTQGPARANGSACCPSAFRCYYEV
jgi:hypothetical protein